MARGDKHRVRFYRIGPVKPGPDRILGRHESFIAVLKNAYLKGYCEIEEAQELLDTYEERYESGIET